MTELIKDSSPSFPSNMTCGMVVIRGMFRHRYTSVISRGTDTTKISCERTKKDE